MNSKRISYADLNFDTFNNENQIQIVQSNNNGGSLKMNMLKLASLDGKIQTFHQNIDNLHIDSEREKDQLTIIQQLQLKHPRKYKKRQNNSLDERVCNWDDDRTRKFEKRNYEQ